MYSENKEVKALKKIGKELVGDNVIRWRFKRDEIRQKVVDDATKQAVLGKGLLCL